MFDTDLLLSPKRQRKEDKDIIAEESKNKNNSLPQTSFIMNNLI